MTCRCMCVVGFPWHARPYRACRQSLCNPMPGEATTTACRFWPFTVIKTHSERKSRRNCATLPMPWSWRYPVDTPVTSIVPNPLSRPFNTFLAFKGNDDCDESASQEDRERERRPSSRQGQTPKEGKKESALTAAFREVAPSN